MPLEDLCTEVITAMSPESRRESDTVIPYAAMPQLLDDDIALLLARTRGPARG